MELRFGTRKSKWALAATNSVVKAAALHAPQYKFNVVQLDSPGDLNHGDLAKLGGTTSFVDALSKEVAAGTIDAAVHTVKDISWPSDVANLPDATQVSAGLRTSGNLVVVAVSKRNDPRDALVFREGESLETYAKTKLRVGTGSLVRAAVLRRLYPCMDFPISRIRGNMDLRLDMLDRGDYDAIIVSMDGLLAVEQAHRATKIFSIDEMPPALGQGIGAVETHEGNEAVIAAMHVVNDAQTYTCLRAEWACLKGLNATCYTPVAGLCESKNGRLEMFAAMYGPCDEVIEARMTGEDSEPERLGTRISEALLEQGAKALQEAWRLSGTELSQDAN